MISSTWGPDSLLGAQPDLPRRVAEALPSDEFRVLMALHPNICSHHSSWQLAEYLSDCERAGVHIPGDVDEWRAGIVASDVTIGDQGSVTFYSAALGNPLLMATTPSHTVDPRSPIAQLMTAAPRLGAGDDIADQIRRAIAEHDVTRYSAVTALTSSEPDHSATIVRSAMYRTLRLPEAPEPAEISALPLPPRPIAGSDSHLVFVEPAGDQAATVTRFPAGRLFNNPDTPRGGHLAIGTREPRRRWIELADVIIGHCGPDTDHWISETLSGLPGCAVASAPTTQGHWLLGDHTEHLLRVAGTEPGCRLFASVAYQRLRQRADLRELTGDWTIMCAGRKLRVEVTQASRAAR
ncbi:MAG: hypothetical protein HOQ24_08850 [Mycobacteriaceae bacterium]|nr:hypothetical protein [Mycobacteriaceae bacterium]